MQARRQSIPLRLVADRIERRVVAVEPKIMLNWVRFNGVLSPLLGLMGSIQAIETIKLLSGAGQTLTGRVLMVDALTLQIREMRLNQDPACPVCHASGK